MKLQGQAADRTAVCAVGLDQRSPIASKQGEDPFNRVVDALPRRLQQCRTDPVTIGFENGDEHVLLAWKEVVEAAAVDLPSAQYVGDRGRRVTLEPEQLHGRFDDARTGVLAAHAFLLVERSIKNKRTL